MKKLFSFSALLFFAAFGLSPASAQNVYQCGNLYQDKPCAGGKRLDIHSTPGRVDFRQGERQRRTQTFLRNRDHSRQQQAQAQREDKWRAAVRSGGCYEIDALVDSAGCSSARRRCALARSSSAGFGIEACAEMQRACARRRVCAVDVME